MPDPNEELVYEEKIDRITEQLEELILDALMAALGKIRERNELFGRLEKAPAENNPCYPQRYSAVIEPKICGGKKPMV